jgi:hypothetical protein
VTEDQLFVPLQAGNDITLTHCIEMWAWALMGKSLPHREYKSIVYHNATGTLWLTHLLQKF